MQPTNATQTTHVPAVPEVPQDPEVVAGLRVLKAGVARDFSAISGKECFANLRDFEHVGLAAVSAAVDRLPLAESAPIQAKDGAGDFSGFQVIRNATTKEPWAVPTSKYHIVQPSAALGPLLDATQEHGLHILASMETLAGGARVKGRAIIANPEFTVQALQDSTDPVMLGFRFSLSHDGSGSVRLDPFAVRVVCLNDNTWGDWMEGVAIRHTQSAAVQVDALGSWLAGLLEQVPNIRSRIQAAAAVKVAPADFLAAALGLGVPVRHLSNLAPDFATWEPVPADGPTLWSSYNALTAYLTHSPKVGGSSDSQEGLLDLAAGLLDPGALDALVAKGKEEAAKLQAKRDAQKDAKGTADAGRITVPVVAGLIR